MRFIYTKTFTVFFLILLAAVVFVFLETKGFVDPVKRVALELPRPIIGFFRALTSPVVNFFSVVNSLDDVIKENAELTEKVRRLEKGQIDRDQLRNENTLLLKELGFVKASKFNLVKCTVLSYDPEGITNTFVINCGKDDGMKEGLAVVSEEHLAGRLIYVGNSTSTAEFVTRPSSAVDVKISRSNSLGILKGSYASGLTYEALSQEGDVKQSDLVVTAGVNSLIPAGILVGEVEQVISKDNDLFRKATVLSPLSFRKLTYIFVVK